MANLDAEEKPRVVLPRQPITEQCQPFLPEADEPLQNYGTARATCAPSREAPNGTTRGDWAKSHQNQTIIEQHCEYFDPDRDGVIWPADTYYACRAWGWAMPLALFFAAAIHLVQSYGSLPGLLPDPFFRIYIENLYKNKHGSSSLTIDNEGRFRPQQFEDFFSKFDKDGKGGLTAWEVWRGLRQQAFALDFFGQASALAEWTFTYILLWPADGILRKEDVRRVYDGSIFFDMACKNPATQPTPSSSGKMPNAMAVPGLLLVGAGAAVMLFTIIMVLGIAVPSLFLIGGVGIAVVSVTATLLSRLLAYRGVILFTASVLTVILIKFLSGQERLSWVKVS